MRDEICLVSPRRKGEQKRREGEREGSRLLHQLAWNQFLSIQGTWPVSQGSGWRRSWRKRRQSVWHRTEAKWLSRNYAQVARNLLCSLSQRAEPGQKALRATMSRIINNYKIQSTATATITTTTTSTATTSGTSRGASAGRDRQGERQQTFAELSVVVSLSLSVSLSVPLHFALRNGTVRGCKVEGEGEWTFCHVATYLWLEWNTLTATISA